MANKMHTTNPEVPDKDLTNSTKKEVEKRSYPPMDLDSIFKFGKYKGQEVEDIIEDDVGYIQWLMDSEITEFTVEVQECVSRRRERRGR